VSGCHQVNCLCLFLLFCVYLEKSVVGFYVFSRFSIVFEFGLPFDVTVDLAVKAGLCREEAIKRVAEAAHESGI
jgi:hypothetical protein